jgi:hypothetical protein
MRSNNLEHERVKPIEQRMRCAFIAAANGLHKRLGEPPRENGREVLRKW